MFNYNRDVYQAEHERRERMLIASQRRVPYHMRRDGFKQATGWLARHAGRPIGGFWSSYAPLVSRQLAIYYRRASTRVVALVLNALDNLIDIAPGRA